MPLKVSKGVLLLLTAYLFSTLAASSALPAAVEERNQCNADNVLRCLRHSSVQATPFCSSYNYVPVVTSTVTTVTPTTTTTTTSPLLETITTTVTLQKRDTVRLAEEAMPNIIARTITTASPVASPNCLSGVPPSRISSACSCLGVTPSTTSVTSTAPPIVETITSTQTILTTIIATVILQPPCTPIYSPCNPGVSLPCCAGSCRVGSNGLGGPYCH